MSENPTPPILSLVKIGSDEFPRYRIVKGDVLRNPVYWNCESETWTTNEGEASVYADMNQALWDQHDLLMESVSDSPCHRYVAPLRIELYGEKPDLARFREWLERAIRIVVNTPDYGYGPDGAVGLIVAHFGELKGE